MKDRIVAWGMAKLCGDTVSLTPRVASDIPLIYASSRFLFLRLLQLVGVRSIHARGTFGFPFICHVGDLSEFPYYHPHAHRLELTLCSSWLKDRDRPVILDVGANGGFFATQLAQITSKSRATIYAFEPVPETFARLDASVRRLDLSGSIYPICAAVADSPREVRLGCVRKNSLLAHIIEEDHARDPAAATAVAQAITLDDFCDAHELDPALIKVDVEGWEPEVLSGAQKTIARCRPGVLFEHNPTRGKTSPIRELLPDYDLVYVDDLIGQRIAPGTSVERVEDIDWICNLFAAPREQEARFRDIKAVSRAI